MTTTATREERTPTDAGKNTLVSVWLTPTSVSSLGTIREGDDVSATDAMNRALQAYALMLEARR